VYHGHEVVGQHSGEGTPDMLDSGSSSTFVSVVVSATLSGAATLP
jgi:hypothetical protein